MGTRQLGEEARDQSGPLTVRAFFGLPLPERHREALGPFLAECQRVGPDFRWTPAENLHLTIRFLGHVELLLAEGIADRVAAAQPARFEVQLGETGAFKRGKMARVLWLGLRTGATEISALAATVEAECARAGLEAEKRGFHAHLTLARARPREGAVSPSLPEPPELEPWRADELILYRSRLGRGGSVYEPMRRLRLG